MAQYWLSKTNKDTKCPLCALYAHTETCVGCPVSARSGYPECRNTPWSDVRDAVLVDSQAGLLAAVEKEYTFLVDVALEDAER